MPWPKIFELIIGTSVSDTSAEKPIAAAIVMPNSPNSRPMLPGMNEIGRNTAISTSVVATTAKPISRLPSTAASSGGSPSSIRRTMFSSTTIASSTTRPIASTAPSSVSTLIEKPAITITMLAAMIETGIVTAGISVARTVPRNR